jgi:hypothetical protein
MSKKWQGRVNVWPSGLGPFEVSNFSPEPVIVAAWKKALINDFVFKYCHVIWARAVSSHHPHSENSQTPKIFSPFSVYLSSTSALP